MKTTVIKKIDVYTYKSLHQVEENIIAELFSCGGISTSLKGILEDRKKYCETRDCKEEDLLIYRVTARIQKLEEI